jgi:UDP-glucose 4-epimerase
MSLRDKSILVTGGAGFIGSHLADRLIKEKPSNLVVVDNFFLGKRSNLDEAKSNYPNLKVYQGDASDLHAMMKIVMQEAINVVFNLAIVPLLVSLEKPKWSYKQNTNITLCLCELARRHAFDTLIHFSSSEVYGSCQYVPMDENHPLNPTTSYGASKASADLLVLSYINTFGIDASIIRPFNNYGSRQNDGSYAGVIPLTIKRILSGEAPVIYGDGKQIRDYLHVSDTVDAAVKIYDCPESKGRVVNVGSGEETTISALVKLIAEHLNCDLPVVYQKSRPGDVRRHIADISLARKLIRFKPQTDLEKGLKSVVEWYQRGKS